MNFIPNAAIVVATVVLLAIGLCLAHMISSQRQDARLQFLLNLMQTFPASGDQSDTSQMRGPLQAVPLRNVVETPRPEEWSAVHDGHPGRARLALQETPLLLAAALRGRGL